ncbi:MAG: hypothetical protein ABW203_05375 [Novosphingobium sp.]
MGGGADAAAVGQRLDEALLPRRGPAIVAAALAGDGVKAGRGGRSALRAWSMVMAALGKAIEGARAMPGGGRVGK